MCIIFLVVLEEGNANGEIPTSLEQHIDQSVRRISSTNSPTFIKTGLQPEPMQTDVDNQLQTEREQEHKSHQSAQIHYEQQFLEGQMAPGEQQHIQNVQQFEEQRQHFQLMEQQHQQQYEQQLNEVSHEQQTRVSIEEQRLQIPHVFQQPVSMVQTISVTPGLNEQTIENSRKPCRRVRTTFSLEQKHALEQAFEKTPYPDAVQREQIALKSQIPEARVQVYIY